MPVPPILAKIMANVFKLKKAALNAFARMDTLVQTANFVSKPFVMPNPICVGDI